MVLTLSFRSAISAEISNSDAADPSQLEAAVKRLSNQMHNRGFPTNGRDPEGAEYQASF